MIYSEFCSVPTPSVLFSTNEVLRGFDFNGTLDWVARGCLEKVKPIDELLAYLLTRDSKLRVGTKEAFQAYLQFVQKSVDKEIFDVKELPLISVQNQWFSNIITPAVCLQGNKIMIEKMSAEESSNFLEHIKRIYGNSSHEDEDDDDTSCHVTFLWLTLIPFRDYWGYV